MLHQLHQAFFGVPPGSPQDARPLVEDIRSLVTAYKRGSWFARFVVWAITGTAGVGIAIQTIRGWFMGGGGS